MLGVSGAKCAKRLTSTRSPGSPIIPAPASSRSRRPTAPLFFLYAAHSEEEKAQSLERAYAFPRNRTHLPSERVRQPVAESQTASMSARRTPAPPSRSSGKKKIRFGKAPTKTLPSAASSATEDAGAVPNQMPLLRGRAHQSARAYQAHGKDPLQRARHTTEAAQDEWSEARSRCAATTGRTGSCRPSAAGCAARPEWRRRQEKEEERHHHRRQNAAERQEQEARNAGIRPDPDARLSGKPDSIPQRNNSPSHAAHNAAATIVRSWVPQVRGPHGLRP